MLSFGGTKNGCIAAEAVIFFDPAKARDVGFARQRAGQGFSKNWFIAAQLGAYLDKGHWLDLARHANAMAARLAAALRKSNKARLAFEPAGNEIFAILETAVDQRLRAAGAAYYPWTPDSLPVAERPGPGEVIVRLLTSWQTTARGSRPLRRAAGLVKRKGRPGAGTPSVVRSRLPVGGQAAT
ncbi:MAG: hypothetical protein WDM84_01130 [Bauldia sp.]